MSPLLETYDLHRRFGRTDALNGVTLTLEEGSVFGLVGPNGAGKTTLVKTLMNIIEPTRGRASVLGTDSRRLGPGEFQQIGYVSENQDLPDWMTVGYLMNYVKPFYPGWDDARADELLSQFELPRDRKLKHLSRGMRMKAALASSLAYRPRLLVLDEPFSGLDPLVREEFVQGLVEAAEETTMLISSHDLAEIESFATHVGFLDQGRLKFAESLVDLSDRFREVEVTVSSPTLPREWPAHWLGVETSPAVVRFVDSQFNADRTERDVRQLLGHDARVETTAMSLRSIFIALARQTRKAA
jgi:ABC-2 type transport system ATP-binding protein